MVRAILDGRKTQTRRAVKPVRGFKHYDICRPDMAADDFAVWWHGKETERVGVWQSCPYGQPGDRLWVRETFQGPLWEEGTWDAGTDYHSPAFCEYRADGGPMPEYVDFGDKLRQGWKPSIHMPRWASRILLEVTDVRVERLQSISEADAIAEGIDGTACAAAVGTAPSRQTLLPVAVHGYAHLWGSLNADRGYGWDTNPWVWVVSFKRVTA